MSLISYSKIQDGATNNASDVNTPLDTVYNMVNGNIEVVNLSAALQAKLNPLTAPDAAWIEIGSGGTAPAFTNSWVNYGNPYATAAFFKDSVGFVHLKGLVKSGTDGASIFTLPTGYRPAKQGIFPSMSNNAAGRVDITTAGTVIPNATTTNPAWISIEGIVFKAA